MTKRVHLTLRISIIKNYLMFGACHLVLIRNDCNLNDQLSQT
jgi:hypothetical protein